MRKLKLNPVNGVVPTNSFGIKSAITFSVVAFLIFFNQYQLTGQCTPADETISGHVLMDMNFNGMADFTDPGKKDITLSLYDASQNLVAQSTTDEFGYYHFEGLANGLKLRLEFQLPSTMMHPSSGNGDLIRFVTVPVCEENLMIHDPMNYCDPNPDIVVMKFIQGGENENDNSATLISVSNKFNTDKNIQPIARKGETGSIWGMAFSKRFQRIFSSAFVKQYAELGPGGLGAIYQTGKENGQYKTSLYVDLVAQGINLGQLGSVNAKDCEYGAQSGRLGLGGLDICEERNSLYAINIYNHSLLTIPIRGADINNIEEIKLPSPSCSDAEYYAFALSYFKDKLYIGMTCTAESSKEASDMVGHVYEYDIESKVFTHIFETDYLKGYWSDMPATDVKTKHWLTDISFTDKGNMLLSLSDRTGSRFCFGEFGRLDMQNGDLLMVWNDNGTWKLEENGRAGIYTGTGVGNGQGPGGGEFFGMDAWPKNPLLHSETAIGSALVIEGTDEVIIPVYDPENIAYSGGLKRFNTKTGAQTGVVTLYQHKTYPEFGKAAGFGELALICEGMPIEIGNHVWTDLNKNGVQDATEPGLENVELTLYNEQCDPMGVTTTDINGFYSFKNLVQDKNYYVVITDDAFNRNIGNMVINGSYLYPTVADKGFGDLNDLNDSDAYIADGVCPNIDGYPYISFKTQGSGENIYNLDFGFSIGKIFDLSLRTTLSTVCQTNAIGDTINFNIEVFNQGTEQAHEVVVTNYLKTGFQFDPSLNPGWKFKEGKVKYKNDGSIEPGESFVLQINLIVLPGEDIINYVNIAEISSALDSENNQGQDIDSFADDDPDNDNGGVPNMPDGPGTCFSSDNNIDDNGILDEDDHDPEWINILDLALRKEVLGDRDIFLPGEKVSFKFEVYNQGNVMVENYQITDYLPAGLEFRQNENPDWTAEGSEMCHLNVQTKIYPNTMQEFVIHLYIMDNVAPQDIINIGEISSIFKTEIPSPRDFDSTPNTNKYDDAGGEPGSLTDNLIYSTSNSIIPDEDDSDPAIIHIKNFDLALTKTIVSNNAKPGQLVEFIIEVFNQGNIPADKITVVDYLPNGLTLEDADWSSDPDDGSRVYYTASIENGHLPLLGLTAGHSTLIPISLRVDAGQPLGLITNYAEIMEAYDIAGNNLGIYDEDSSPDNDKFNDNGGQPNTPNDDNISDDGTIDEDDSDPAQIYISNVVLNQNCVCLMNATNSNNGEFFDEWFIQAPSGQSWWVLTNTGITNLNPLDPMIENAIGDGYSNYTLSGIHNDGTGYEISFTNNLGDVESYSKAPGTCVYEDMVIEGLSGTCGSSTEIYSIVNPDPDATYQWTVSGGGVISGSDTGNSVLIAWGAMLGGPFQVSAQNTGTPVCQAPTSLDVQIGNSSGTLVSKDEIIVSIGQNCEVEITANMILNYGYNPITPYQITLQLPNGTYLPSNVITSEYLNIPLKINLLDLCGGNSAMSQVVAIDKLAPSIDCSDEVVLCDNMDAYEGPFVTDNCDSNPQAILVHEEVFNEDCNSPYSQRIVRTYVALDASGNFSEPCQKTIYTQRANTTDLVWPENLVMIDNSAIVCGTYPTCEVCDCETFPYPDPAATGTPSLNGESIYPSTLGHCQYVVGFEDLVLVNTPCFKKLIRFWTVHEICGDVNVFNIISYQQDIEIIDNIPPIPLAPNNITLHTDGESCGSMVNIPSLTVTDNCDAEISIDITYPGGFMENSNGGSVWMPAGQHKVWYTIYDECGNYSQVEMDVTIDDHIPPVAVCQQNTVVALTNDGFAEVPAYVFDSGSYDDCTIVHMEVKRFETENACELDQDVYGPIITFCCADVGNYVMVGLRVYDDYGNTTECMVEVLVQDANPPILTIPADQTIECTFPYELNDLSYFGSPSVYDVCGAEINEQIITNINNCGVGYIERVFTATDGEFTVSKTQTINIINSNAYDLDNIDWPADFLTAESCNAGDLSPQNLEEQFAFPKFNNETYCDDLGFDYSDEIYLTEEEGNSCYKIVRTWVVQDWCNFENGEYKTWNWEQIIMVINSIPPVIVTNLDPIVECSYDDDCELGYLELTATGDDDCTPGNNLYWEYAIDLDNDNILDIEGNYNGATLDLSGEYPIGNHKVFWRLNDYCGNTTNKVQFFTIENCTTPTAICMDAVSIAIQPSDLDGDGVPDTEMAIITANEFNAGSYHTCGYDLNYSFSLDITNSTLLVDCADVSESGMAITLYVTDSNGNFDFCETVLYVQDNNLEEICDKYDDCLIYPDTDITVQTCNPDLSPEFLGTVFELSGDCPCQNIIESYVDLDISDPNSTCTLIQRDWTLSFDCGVDREFLFTQFITVLNAEAPLLLCGADINADATNNCEAYLYIDIPTIASSDCNTGLFITHNSIYADDSGDDASGRYPVGSTTVVFTLEDDCGNLSTCEQVITIHDVTPPVCVANDITLTVGPNGITIINPSDIDGGSTDECGIQSISVQPESFTCADIGENTITLTVTDNNGNTSFCTSIVTIEDNSGPLCSTQDLTVILDENGMFVLDPYDIYTGSPCGGLDVTLGLDTDTFSCDDIGENTVVLTVTESNGNFEICEAIITVTDTIAPICQLLNINAYLDENGFVSVNFEDINDGTTDTCGEIIDTTISNMDFDCNDVGQQIITVSCEDNSGNISTCESIITVIDSIAPICMVNDLFVQIGPSGEVVVTGADLDAGSTDECGIASITVFPNTFTCADVGENTVTVTVTDNNGVSSVCTSIVTIEDESGPLCSTQDILVILDANGQYFLQPEEIFTGNPCGSGSVSLEVEPNLFECDNIGLNTVTLMVTDEFGTTDVCTAIVEVMDTIAPICDILDIDVYLDSNGTYEITFEDIDNGIMDPCGIITDTIITPDVVNCDDLGLIEITVSLTDNSGNNSTCTAEITVIDTIAPICVSNDVVLILDDTARISTTTSSAFSPVFFIAAIWSDTTLR